MTRISDLSQDLIEEILSRVSLTSQPAARSTCKQWNSLYKDERFTKKHLGKSANDTMVIVACDSGVCLMSVDLHGVRKQKRGFIELSTKLIGQLNRLKVAEVYHCDGLLLCLPKYSMVKSDPVVWNPYLGQVRWIKPRKKLKISGTYKYYLRYDNNNNHKILRFLDEVNIFEYDIYDLKYDSWRVLDLTRDWTIKYYHQRGLNLKGNTYFVAHKREAAIRDYLICFDYTSERFRHCLCLESNYRKGDSVILSAFREDQLAVLFHRVDAYEIEIRITTKIEEANEVSLRSFLKVDVKPFSDMYWAYLQHARFFVDENKKVAFIYDSMFIKVNMIGEDNYFKIPLVKSTSGSVVCCYVPSSMQIQKGPVDA